MKIEIEAEEDFEPNENDFIRVVFSNRYVPGLIGYTKFSWKSNLNIPDKMVYRDVRHFKSNQYATEEETNHLWTWSRIRADLTTFTTLQR